MDINAITKLGDLLEEAQERLDDNIAQLTEGESQSEINALDQLWAHYQNLLEND